jgi:hypothetical protein
MSAADYLLKQRNFCVMPLRERRHRAASSPHNWRERMAINLVTVAVALARRAHNIDRDGIETWGFDDNDAGFRYVVERNKVSKPHYRVTCWHGAEFVVSCPAPNAVVAASLVASISEGS